MLEKITKLIDVKSIVTLVLTGVFAYMAITNRISEEQFMNVFIMIMTYFFTKRKGQTEG